ncbi:MAG: hypothetical protein GXO79_11715 [Chlorobi bacterium]|nr:hypothetical protein [Chlorobiota bacterium]
MPRLSIEEKSQIKMLSKKELESIVIKLMTEKENYNYVLVNYLNKEKGEQDLFEKAKIDIDSLRAKRYKGFSEQLQLANLISACVKRINEFTKISKKKNLEADLILYVLDIPFSLPNNFFGTCFTQFDYKTGLLLKRLITLVTKKLHEDYRIEYIDIINNYLKRLHDTSDHLDFIYEMPKSI